MRRTLTTLATYEDNTGQRTWSLFHAEGSPEDMLNLNDSCRDRAENNDIERATRGEMAGLEQTAEERYSTVMKNDGKGNTGTGSGDGDDSGQSVDQEDTSQDSQLH